MIVMNMQPAFPSAISYTRTNGCGASNENSVLRSGMQNRKRIVVAKPKIPVKNALLRSPLAATTLQVCLSMGTMMHQV